MKLKPLTNQDRRLLLRQARRFTEQELAAAIGGSRYMIARALLGHRLQRASRAKIRAFLA